MLSKGAASGNFEAFDLVKFYEFFSAVMSCQILKFITGKNGKGIESLRFLFFRKISSKFFVKCLPFLF